ncbi:MAG: DUF1858 domain-containing protein [Candidatus Marinimicrobia bacterium]|nr:DUF1858 domain-containing protein [Candidatus Neomarinimicrobiota bacterium]
MIDKSTPIEDIVENFPELIKPLRKFGIVCIQCGEPVWGDLGEQMDNKNINGQEQIINKLNKIITEEQ